MNDKLEGLVLEASPYQENDLLLKTLTRENGLLTLIAKGSQKMSAHCHYLPFGLYEFIVDLKEGKNIYNPRSTRLLKTYYDDKKIKRLAFFSCLVSVINENAEFIDEGYFEDLLFVMENCNENNMYLLGSLFVSQVLKKSGISPMVDGCVVCGNTSVIGLNDEKGGFVCRNHAQETDIIDTIRLKKFRMINKASMENYEILKDFEYDAKDFDLMVSFYKENADSRLKAYDFFRTL